jgi:hypothetical protein
MKWFHETVRRKRSDLWPNNWILHHDNAPAPVKQFLDQKLKTKMEHPLYAPDLALKDISQQEFQKSFQQWQHCWAKCIAAQGEYFEGDPSW